MARRQCHLVELGRVPGRDDVAARVGLPAQLLDDGANLVEALTGIVLVAAGVLGAPVPPLERVAGAHVALFVRKVLLLQKLLAGVASPDVYVLTLNLSVSVRPAAKE